jgi:hypothetical protein
VAVQVAEQGQRLAAGEVRPQAGLARHVSDRAMRPRRVAGAVDSENFHVARRRAQQAEHQPDHRCLAGAVGPQAAEDLTPADLEVERGQGVNVAEPFAQPDHSDGGLAGRRPCGT